MENNLYTYLEDGISFISQQAAKMRKIYFPLCGTSSDKIKSSITPYLSGDIKIDKNCYLTKPMSTEDLRMPMRNFFIYVKDQGFMSLATRRDDDVAHVEIGPLWHKLVVKNEKMGIEIETLSFVPVSGENIELMQITVKNISKEALEIVPTGAIPIFARALANKHDHEHVTSLLHRITQIPHGLLVEPQMLFNEEGHKTNHDIFYVMGMTAEQENPLGVFPTINSFCGESGTLESPEAVFLNISPETIATQEVQGKEAVGAIRFHEAKLKPLGIKRFIMAIGVAPNENEASYVFDSFNSSVNIQQALDKNKEFWQNKAFSLCFRTGRNEFNSWIQWVELQPVLRRIFGCSFMPDHDYGKGGKGWRDIWQDLLSLILIEPEEVRSTLVNNFAGVRIDGSNATIIGSSPGEFLADRNAISRVWMDHGTWPFMTLLLYINQTGDYDILLEETTYFRDAQQSRTLQKDVSWNTDYGNHLRDCKGNIYAGKILEHILVQHLVPFFNVGDHNIIRLESADWNDGLDMAFENGESVAFMSFYGGNFLSFATLLEDMAEAKKGDKVLIAEEILILLDSIRQERVDYNSAEEKKKLLFEKYYNAVQPELSGKKVEVEIKALVSDLRLKGHWICNYIRANEKISIDHNGEKNTWFNGYYDNQKNRVEGIKEDKVWMTLAGQVFPVMSGLASKEEIKQIVASVSTHLKDGAHKGVRLNTDFGVSRYLDLGRAFGFAYGTKENGAFFSHMIVMYAYALYKRNFVREGYEVLNSLFKMSLDTDKSKIYPGVPEYFDLEGRGHYHYLTGAASWLILTSLTEVFGICGERGDLTLSPKLVKDEFAGKTEVYVSCQFAGKNLTVLYFNENALDYGQYRIKAVTLNDQAVDHEQLSSCKIKIKRDVLLSSVKDVKLCVILG